MTRPTSAGDRQRPTDERAAGDRDPPPELVRARRVGRLLDDSVRLPGTSFRFGLDPVLGVAPVAGDTVAYVCSLYVVFAGVRLGVPANAVGKMLALATLDYLIGSIPLLGVLADAVLKANLRNVETIEAHVAPRT